MPIFFNFFIKSANKLPIFHRINARIIGFLLKKDAIAKRLSQTYQNDNSLSF